MSLDWPFDNLGFLSEKFRQTLLYVLRSQAHRLISTSLVLKDAEGRALAAITRLLTAGTAEGKLVSVGHRKSELDWHYTRDARATRSAADAITVCSFAQS